MKTRTTLEQLTLTIDLDTDHVDGDFAVTAAYMPGTRAEYRATRAADSASYAGKRAVCAVLSGLGWKQRPATEGGVWAMPYGGQRLALTLVGVRPLPYGLLDRIAKAVGGTVEVVEA